MTSRAVTFGRNQERNINQRSGNVTWATTVGNSLPAPQTVKIELVYDPAFALLGMDPRVESRCSKTCTHMFTAALITVSMKVETTQTSIGG